MKNFLFTKLASTLLTAGLIGLGSQSARAAFIAINTQSNYFQNFNSLISQGKSSTLTPGWAFKEFGTGNNQIEADNGGSASAGVYSYGGLKASDRALGDLRADGGKYGMFGANFQNTGPGPITRLNVSYTGEEWRLGAEGRGADRLQFQYSVHASSLDSGTWINAPGLDFLTPNLTGVGAHDGTLAANQTQVAGVINFLNIPVGGTFWVRWVDAQLPGGGKEDGLAIDNFSITAVPEPATLAAGFCMAFMLGSLLFKRGGFWTPKVARPSVA